MPTPTVHIKAYRVKVHVPGCECGCQHEGVVAGRSRVVCPVTPGINLKLLALLFRGVLSKTSPRPTPAQLHPGLNCHGVTNNFEVCKATYRRKGPRDGAQGRQQKNSAHTTRRTQMCALRFPPAWVRSLEVWAGQLKDLMSTVSRLPRAVPQREGPTGGPVPRKLPLPLPVPWLRLAALASLVVILVLCAQTAVGPWFVAIMIAASWGIVGGGRELAVLIVGLVATLVAATLMLTTGPGFSESTLAGGGLRVAALLFIPGAGVVVALALYGAVVMWRAFVAPRASLGNDLWINGTDVRAPSLCRAVCVLLLWALFFAVPSMPMSWASYLGLYRLLN